MTSSANCFPDRLLETETLMLKISDKAPAFTLSSDEGKEISLSDFKGKSAVIFFYPKANTSG